MSVELRVSSESHTDLALKKGKEGIKSISNLARLSLTDTEDIRNFRRKFAELLESFDVMGEETSFEQIKQGYRQAERLLSKEKSQQPEK